MWIGGTPGSFGKIKEYVDGPIQDQLNGHISEFICNRFKTPDSRIQFKREKISSEGEYLSKKRYVVRVRDNEGVPCDKFSYVRGGCRQERAPDEVEGAPEEVRGEVDVGEALPAGDEIQPLLKEIFDAYKALPLNDLGYIKNLTTAKRMLDHEDRN